MDALGYLLTVIVVASAFAPDRLGTWIARVKTGYNGELGYGRKPGRDTP